MKPVLAVVGLTLLIFVGGAWWSQSLQERDSNVISTNGIHYHPELEIFVGDKQIVIPTNIGLVGAHSPIHTHEDLPVIHLEFEGRVTRDDTKLARFFEVWGKDINAFGENVTMTVNGEPNDALGEYELKDGDKVVLRYE